jgi:hypothetical protein
MRGSSPIELGNYETVTCCLPGWEHIKFVCKHLKQTHNMFKVSLMRKKGILIPTENFVYASGGAPYYEILGTRSCREC